MTPPSIKLSSPPLASVQDTHTEKMTFVSSLLGSSSEQKWADRLRNAEASLLEFGRRFDKSGDTNTVEVMDTSIPESVIYKNADKKDKKSCRMFKSSTDESAPLNENGPQLNIHGTKVTTATTPGEEHMASAAPLVMLHGYGASSMHFYRNMHGLSRQFYKTVYSLDMLGWGLSSRPTSFFNSNTSLEETEDFFVESLEAWRVAQDIPKFTLAGHSMAGYLSVAYSERYPERVERLILMSPAGVNEKTPDFQSRITSNATLTQRFFFGMVGTLFNRGTTPFSFIRTISESRGRSMISRYVNGRLPTLTQKDEREAMADYLYVNGVMPGSGEACLSRILEPTTHAKRPTVHRIPKLKVKDISFIYGESDWMDVNGGLEVERICKEMKMNGQTDAPNVQVHGVQQAGHMLHLDNWEEFNSAVIMAGGGEHTLSVHAPRPGKFPSNGVENWYSSSEARKRPTRSRRARTDSTQASVPVNA